MLFAEATRYRAGLTLYGDYIDFSSLHSTVHQLADQIPSCPSLGHIKSLDARGGSVFRNFLGGVEGALIRAAASTQPLDLFE